MLNDYSAYFLSNDHSIDVRWDSRTSTSEGQMNSSRVFKTARSLEHKTQNSTKRMMDVSLFQPQKSFLSVCQLSVILLYLSRTKTGIHPILPVKRVCISIDRLYHKNDLYLFFTSCKVYFSIYYFTSMMQMYEIHQHEIV